jgi:hypothetical protein
VGDGLGEFSDSLRIFAFREMRHTSIAVQFGLVEVNPMFFAEQPVDQPHGCTLAWPSAKFSRWAASRTADPEP